MSGVLSKTWVSSPKGHGGHGFLGSTQILIAALGWLSLPAPQISGKLKITAENISLEKVQGQINEYIDRIEFDPNQVKIAYEMIEETRRREQKSISMPGPALMAIVAVTLSIVTSGVGGAVMAGLGNTLWTTIAGAAISSLSSQIVTQVALGILAQQSPGDILKTIIRPETLKGAITSALTAGTVLKT